ncbi:MAG: inositol polyphosphate 5-phosphatase [Cirrosporium novae-zelandiae]|nr:MAG: inositol polyphosphate 5-phosphatase [Cirrosporium novae-zelandiae]
MSIRILLRDHPHRTIALVTESHALIFRHSPSSADLGYNGRARFPEGEGAAPRCMVEFSPLASLDLEGYRPLTNLGIHGTLGLVTINNDVFICVVTGASQVATVRPKETAQRIHGVEFYCLNRSSYDYVQLDDVYSEYDASSDRLDRVGGDIRESESEHPCASLRKLLSGGTFYYSVNFDLTNRLQNRSNDNATFDVDSLDNGFLWNSYMINPLLRFRSRLADHERKALDASCILTSTIRGYVFTLNIPPSISPLKNSRSGLPSTLTLISRLSCRRAGTRFNARGIDDDGNVANFVETETVFWNPAGICFSYAQVRGSVPVFWEQASSLIPGQQKTQITRSPEATQPAFDKHFESLEVKYGAVHVLNLLSESRPQEAELTRRYRYHLSQNPLSSTPEKGSSFEHRLLQATEYDFNAETKGPAGYEAASMVKHLVANFADAFGYYMLEDNQDLPTGKENDSRLVINQSVVLQQEGTFRTNCLDCLDRTNLVQTILSQLALESFLGGQGVRGSSDFWARHSSLWADNGDALSIIYAGTGALKSSFTRHGKMSLAGALADARKSATRLYINNFADKERQNTMDLLLGRLVGQAPVDLYDPINDFVVNELNRRSSEYSTTKTINILVATFNVNGRTEGIAEDLSSWICPKLHSSQQFPEIVAVGFQEIVELSPQQIMSTDPGRRLKWEEAVKRTLNNNAKQNGAEEYVLLRSGQLVGAALLIFVRMSVLPFLKNVEGSVKKTGLSGMAGNKGAVAIRMDYCSTRICFVTAHLAAGFANYEERNRDYQTINHGLRFQKNRSIEDHDSIIWLGDFNYRIGLGNDKVRKAIINGDLDFLYENDQLNLQMVAGLSFPFYTEGRITFLPTYKYDIGTEVYDTSEKARIPAWCDRVLKKGSNLRQTHYSIAPLLFSDHRPVYATFECVVNVIDEVIKERLGHEIYKKRRAEVGNSTANAQSDDTDDEDLIGYDSIAPGLPPASSDRRKWWLDNGLPARSELHPPDSNMTPNPLRPSNPFSKTGEPSWVPKSQTPPPPPKPRGSSSARSVQSNTSQATSTSVAPTGYRHAVPPPWPPTSSHPSKVSSSPNLRSESRLSTSALSTTSSKTSSKPPPSIASSSRQLPNTISQSSTGGAPELHRKPPPIKPKKPDVLRSETSQSTLSSTSTRPSVPRSPSVTSRASASISLPAKPGPRPQLSIAENTLLPPSVRPKPGSMRSGSPSGNGVAINTSSYISDKPEFPPPPRRSTAPIQSPQSHHITRKEVPPPVPPPRGSARGTTAGGPGNGSGEEREEMPPLPPRRAATNVGLMDEDHVAGEKEALGGWKALKPQ